MPKTEDTRSQPASQHLHSQCEACQKPSQPACQPANICPACAKPSLPEASLPASVCPACQPVPSLLHHSSSHFAPVPRPAHPPRITAHQGPRPPGRDPGTTAALTIGNWDQCRGPPTQDHRQPGTTAARKGPTDHSRFDDSQLGQKETCQEQCLLLRALLHSGSVLRKLNLLRDSQKKTRGVERHKERAHRV
ncbi:uncharacterized protein [Ranitomeya imitator]|uniref:uncharacterized protein isoform X2 n=1 Tax=Ranitomeya imitator TaxID=111125 RepID=UPI0037E718A0